MGSGRGYFADWVTVTIWVGGAVLSWGFLIGLAYVTYEIIGS